MPDAEPDPLTILAEALDRTDPADRRAFLDRACGDDATLRQAVESLLAGTGPVGSPGRTAMGDVDEARTLAHPSSPTADRAGEPTQPGTTVDVGVEGSRAGHSGGFRAGQLIDGRYTLLAVLGQGGMGTVYRAEQARPVRRQVALKLIRGGMDTRVVLARFDAERQALALMEHPNIARVFDGGTTEAGQPFFVMELVEGEPITGYCDRRRLPVRARIELFVIVCQAVQHAHQKGIIHRDLKPGNVLVAEVDGKPTPKVIDFGVAKATGFDLTDQSLHETGAIVGTPTYMSPEQADPSSMDIDTRTDIYALGVILYELLVGSPPIDARQFRRVATLEMLRMVREFDPPRPSTRLSTAENRPNIAADRDVEPAKLAESLRGELDWVVMKALEKDRNRRYETASGFARDLQRYIADEVVEARPPSTGYRLRKFIRRHRARVVAVGLIFLALLAGVVGTTIGLVRAEHQRGIAEERSDRLVEANEQTRKEKARAEENFATARALILDLGTRINQIETGQANPRLSDLGRKQALDKAREQFDLFLADRPEDEKVQMQAAALHRYAANIGRLLNDYPAAEAAYASAVKLLEGLATRVPGNSVYRNELALALCDRAMLEKRMGKLKDADATLDRAALVLDGTPISAEESAHRRTLTLGLIDIDRSEIAYRRGLFPDFERLAGLATERLDQWQKVPEAERLAVEPLFAAMAVKRRAMALRELGKTPEALATHEDAVARIKALSGPQADRDFRFEDCESRRERARTSALVAERREAAVLDLGDVIRVAEKLVEENPHIAYYREGLAADYLGRGELLILLGRPEPAAADLAKSLTVSRELLDRHGRLSDSLLVRAQTYLALGRARAANGKGDEAAGHWKNAITIFEMGLKLDPDNFHHRRGLAEARSLAAAPR